MNVGRELTRSDISHQLVELEHVLQRALCLVVGVEEELLPVLLLLAAVLLLLLLLLLAVAAAAVSVVVVDEAVVLTVRQAHAVQALGQTDYLNMKKIKKLREKYGKIDGFFTHLDLTLCLDAEYSRMKASRTKAVKMLSMTMTAVTWKERKKRRDQRLPVAKTCPSAMTCHYNGFDSK